MTPIPFPSPFVHRHDEFVGSKVTVYIVQSGFAPLAVHPEHQFSVLTS